MPSHLDDLLALHKGHVALQFSGGRDSLAMLLLLEPHWDKLTVFYCNSGDAFPETLALVERVKIRVPSFIEVPGFALETRATYGWPSDILPSGARNGWDIYHEQPLLQGRENCCARALMLPLHAAMKVHGITLILRGQRDDDYPKSPLKSGESVDGMTVFYPLNDWTTEEVEEYILDRGEMVPAYYRAGMTSAPDCMHCTAWLEHGGYPFLRRFYPKTARVVQKRIMQIFAVLNPPMLQMSGIAGDYNG